MICIGLWAVSASLALARAASLDQSRVGRTFTLDQIPIDSPDLSTADSIRAPYFKFGVEIPAELEDAISRDILPGQTTIPTKSSDYDQSYGSLAVIEV